MLDYNLAPQNHTYTSLPPPFQNSSSGYLRGCLQATVLSKTLKKLNSQVFLCAFFFFKLILGLFPISPRFGVAVYPPSQSSADGDSSAELYLTHLEPSRRAHKARRRCSPLTVSHVLPVKFLVPRPPHITFISFIYAAWATVTRGNPHLTDTLQTVTLLTQRPPPLLSSLLETPTYRETTWYQLELRPCQASSPTRRVPAPATPASTLAPAQADACPAHIPDPARLVSVICFTLTAV